MLGSSPSGIISIKRFLKWKNRWHGPNTYLKFGYFQFHQMEWPSTALPEQFLQSHFLIILMPLKGLLQLRYIHILFILIL